MELFDEITYLKKYANDKKNCLECKNMLTEKRWIEIFNFISFWNEQYSIFSTDISSRNLKVLS